MWSLCAQDKAGAVSQPSGPRGRTPEHRNTSMLPVRLSSSSPTHKTAGVISATRPCLPRLLTHQQQQTVSSVMQCCPIRGASPNKPILHQRKICVPHIWGQTAWQKWSSTLCCQSEFLCGHYESFLCLCDCFSLFPVILSLVERITESSRWQNPGGTIEAGTQNNQKHYSQC